MTDPFTSAHAVSKNDHWDHELVVREAPRWVEFRVIAVTSADEDVEIRADYDVPEFSEDNEYSVVICRDCGIELTAEDLGGTHLEIK